jgi:hypothetical protein
LRTPWGSPTPSAATTRKDNPFEKYTHQADSGRRASLDARAKTPTFVPTRPSVDAKRDKPVAKPAGLKRAGSLASTSTARRGSTADKGRRGAVENDKPEASNAAVWVGVNSADALLRRERDEARQCVHDLKASTCLSRFIFVISRSHSHTLCAWFLCASVSTPCHPHWQYGPRTVLMASPAYTHR